jgi:FdhE protein
MTNPKRKLRNFEGDFLELKKRIQQLKKKRPGYKEILDFYQKVREEQEKAKASLNIDPIKLKKEWKELLTKEGFPILERKDFQMDIEASTTLFHSLCNIGKHANPYMAEQARKIGEAIDNKGIDPKELLKPGVKEQRIDQIANAFGLDKKVLLFLIQSSIKPSIEAGMEQLLNELDTSTWLKGFCPVCGSLPYLSLLKEEVGKRYLLCSYCGYQWRIERLVCPFCGNKEQESLQYFHAEGGEAHRIDLCEKCHQYIKTIDLRKTEALDPSLEDLATLHLDILASQKGYKRPVPNPWTT